MSYKYFEMLCQMHGVKPSDVSKATGVSTATLTSWKKGKYQPKYAKQQAIADYFGVSVDYLMTGKEPAHYLDEESAEAAQDAFSDPNLRVLFKAAAGSKPENIMLAAELLTRLKETGND